MSRTVAALLAPAIAIALASAAAILPATTMGASGPVRIGSGSKSCTLGPRANCKGVKARWGVRFHGNLKGANLQGADLTGADLRGSNLTGADLRGARFDHADLVYASLGGSNFTSANFTVADLAGSYFKDTSVNPPVYWITTGATWDNTVCSNGTTSSTGC